MRWWLWYAEGLSYLPTLPLRLRSLLFGLLVCDPLISPYHAFLMDLQTHLSPKRCYPEKWQSSKTTAAVARPSHLSSDKVPPAGPWELFDLTNDPQERVNAFDQLRNTQSSLVAALMVLRVLWLFFPSH